MTTIFEFEGVERPTPTDLLDGMIELWQAEEQVPATLGFAVGPTMLVAMVERPEMRQCGLRLVMQGQPDYLSFTHEAWLSKQPIENLANPIRPSEDPDRTTALIVGVCVGGVVDVWIRELDRPAPEQLTPARGQLVEDLLEIWDCGAYSWSKKRRRDATTDDPETLERLVKEEQVGEATLRMWQVIRAYELDVVCDGGFRWLYRDDERCRWDSALAAELATPSTFDNDGTPVVTWINENRGVRWEAIPRG